MKIVFALTMILCVIVFCGCPNSYYVEQRQFNSADLMPLMPEGGKIGDPCGKNWWHGQYYNVEVLFHAVVTQQYVTLDMIFVKE